MSDETRNSLPGGRRRRARRAAIAVLIGLLPFAAHALWDRIELRRLIYEIDAIRAKGEPVTERDAGDVYLGTTQEHRQASRSYLAAALLASGPIHAPQIVEIQEWVYAGVPLKHRRDETARTLFPLVYGHPDALALVDKANLLEFRGFEPGTDYSYRTSSLASLSRLLQMRTVALAARGDGDGAVDSVIASLTLRRIGQRVRWFHAMSPRLSDIPIVLSLSSPSPHALQRLQKALEDGEDYDEVLQDVLRTRAWFVELLWSRYYGSDPHAPQNYLLPMRSVTETVLRPWLTRQFVRTLREWAVVAAAARQPWPEKARAVSEIARYRSAPAVSSRVARAATGGRFLGFGGVLTALAADGGSLVGDRCARTAVAIERFRRDYGTTLPKALDDLVPRYLTAVPQDPFSGQALRYKVADGAYTVYSVGSDGRDDGGDLASQLHAVIKQGWGRRELKGRDAGVRVLIH